MKNKLILFRFFIIISAASLVAYIKLNDGTCSGGKNCTGCSTCNYCKNCSKNGGSFSDCK